MDEINETLLEAREELKRLEHIIYVSLKYTRTVDVIVNALKRVVECLNFIIEAFLEKAEKAGLFDTPLRSPPLKAKKLGELYPEDQTIQKYLTFYAFVRMILKLPHHKRQEYRRHVTLIADLENGTAEIKIDHLVNVERFLHRFFQYAWEVIEGKRLDE